MSDRNYTSAIEQEQLSEKDSAPAGALYHRDSELTISGSPVAGASKDEKEADLEGGADVLAIAEPQEELIDGPFYGWVVVFAAFFSQMIPMGICNIYGVYQSYYLRETFNGRATTFQLAWIGSIAVMALDLMGPFAGSLCEYYGHRRVALIGVVIMSLSLVAAAFSTELWQLYLTQGLIYGMGGSLTYFASLSLPSQWFRKNRGLVTGIAISGGGIGGLWMSPVISGLLVSKGLRWTMMAVAIAHAVLLIPTCMFFKTRVESGRERAKRISEFGYRKGENTGQKRKFVDFTILKEKRFLLLFIAGIFVVSGYFTPFYFMKDYALQHNVSDANAALMVGLMNGFSAVGRIVMGFVSDRIGCINALFISTFAASLTLLLIWTFAKTVAVMFLFSILYGLCCGAYLSSTVSVSGAICGLERLATVTGIIYAGMAIGSTIGSPTSGAILDSIGHGTNYTGIIIWSGTVMSVGTIILFVLKYITNKNMFARV